MIQTRFEEIIEPVGKNQNGDLEEISSTQNDPGAISYLEDNDKNTAVVAFFKGKNLWVIFDQKKFLHLKTKEYLENLILFLTKKSNHLLTQSYSVVSLVMVFTKGNKMWYDIEILKLESTKNDEEFVIKGHLSSVDVNTFDLREIDETLKIILVSQVDRKVMHKNTPEYQVLKTIQGIAVIC